MKKIIFFLIALLISGNVFAQVLNSHQLPIDTWRSSYASFWNNKVNKTATWGKWLMSTKPYWDNIFDVQMKSSSSMVTVIELFKPSATEDNAKKMDTAMRAVNKDFYQTMQGISPPEELKALHAIMLEESLLMTIFNGQDKGQVEAKMEGLVVKFQKEQDRVFKQHGVPQRIIDGFLK
ncbi:MAG: hypothetical protein WCI27_10670 [Candidatus Omnitrophota bacterium]